MTGTSGNCCFPYPAYRDSGVKWLGEIPEHWEVRKLKYIANVQPSNVDKKTDDGENCVRLCNYIDVYYHEQITSVLDFMEASATPEERRKFQLKVGDVCITKDSEEWNDIAVPAYVAEDIPDLLCGYHLAMVRPLKDKVLGGFLARAFAAQGINEQFQVEAVGITRYGLSQDALTSGLFPVPPLPEQRGIAGFLDRETGKLDAMVERKERLIELLLERRAALISHAVTKGLNPTAPIRDSGIAWLLKIPKHWAVAPLYARYRVQLGKMLDEKRITGEHLAPYLRNVDVQWGRINVSDLPEMDFKPEDRERFRLECGDLLVCEGGEVGRCAIWKGELPECYYQKAIHRLRPLKNIDLPQFFYYVLCRVAQMGVFVAEGNPNTIDHLPAEKLRVYRFAFPPKNEQQEIADYLDRETGNLDALIARIRDGIAALREYRTSLISAAVTGRIDVRCPTA